MSINPHNPEIFARDVCDILKKMHPGFDINLVSLRELIVNGRRLDLENLFRMVAYDTSKATEIVENYIDNIFQGEDLNVDEWSWGWAVDRIMPRIQPASIFEHLDRNNVAHVPYVNDTVIVFVIDLPTKTVSITRKQALKWGVTIDELDEIARKNLKQYQSNLSFQFVESKEGGKAAVFNEQDSYDAARLLLEDLHTILAPQLGRDFLAAAPARDCFVAFSKEPEALTERMKRRADQDYQRLPYPVSNKLFVVTRDGVAGTEGPSPS